jgi:hypothetical protein
MKTLRGAGQSFRALLYLALLPMPTFVADPPNIEGTWKIGASRRKVLSTFSFRNITAFSRSSWIPPRRHHRVTWVDTDGTPASSNARLTMYPNLIPEPQD